MTRLKIIQTPVRFHPFIGGVEKYVLELSKELTGLGHQVTVVCADEPHADSGAVHGIRVLRLPYIAKVSNTNITLRLFRTLMKSDFDVIHTHIPTPWSADISALVSFLKRKPLCVTYHNDLTGEGMGGVIARVYNATALHLVLRRAKTIVVTQPKYVEYSGHLKAYERKITIIPPGVAAPERTKERLQPKASHIFFLSVLDKHHDYKGLDILLQAMSEIRERQPEARLLVGGGGDAVGKYRELAERLGISDSVEFLGTLSDEELSATYQSCSMFVLPSINKQEGFGIVALEALAFGTPVITTHVAGSSGFIKSHDAGIVTAPSDISALADALMELLGNPEAARSMGERGAAAVREEFSWKSIATKMTEKY